MDEFEEQMKLNQKSYPKILTNLFEDAHNKLQEFQEFCEQMSHLEATVCGERTENSCIVNEEFSTLIRSMNDITTQIFSSVNKTESELGNDDFENKSLTTISKATNEINQIGIEADNCQDTVILLKKITYGFKQLSSNKENCSPNDDMPGGSESASAVSSSDFSFQELNNRGVTSSPFSFMNRLDSNDDIKTPEKKY